MEKNMNTDKKRNWNKIILWTVGGLIALVVVLGIAGGGAEQPAKAPVAIEQTVKATATPKAISKPVAKPTDGVDWSAYRAGMKTAIDAQARDKECDMLQFQFDKQADQTDEAIKRGIDPSKILEYIDGKMREAKCL
jgi:hypothetical protein